MMQQQGGHTVPDNSYALEPREEERFYPSKVKKEVRRIMEERLKDESYDHSTAALLTEELTKTIRDRLKNGIDDYRMPRYKFVCQVVFGELKGQGLRIASKCLWNVNYDNYVNYTYQKNDFYCTAMVFGCYCE